MPDLRALFARLPGIDALLNHADLNLFHWVETAEEAWDKVVEFYELS